MNGSRHQLKTPAGFTLVELLIVIVIVAILSAVIVPEMKGTLEGERLHSASRSLTRALGVAYRQSVTSNRPHRLRIDGVKGRFTIERRATADESPTGFVPLEGVSDASGGFDSRIRIEIVDSVDESEPETAAFSEAESGPDAAEEKKSPDTIVFLPDGTTEKREIRLRDRHGFGIALRLNPITARVKLVPLDRQ